MKVDKKMNPTASQVQASKGREVSSDLKAKQKSASALSPEMLSESSKVQVSDRAQMMAKAKAIAKADSADEAKIARLQKMIDAGTYKVDSSAVADKLVDEHLLMVE